MEILTFLSLKNLKIQKNELSLLNKNIHIHEGIFIQIPSHFYYIIQKRDTLSKIANKFRLPLNLLQKVNNYPKKIYFEEKIIIPVSYLESKTFIHSSRDSKNPDLKSILKKVVLSANTNDYTNILNQAIFDIDINLYPPLRGVQRVASRYNEKENIYHFGVTFRARQGKVFSSYRGKVIFYGLVRGLGETVILQHQVEEKNILHYLWLSL